MRLPGIGNIRIPQALAYPVVEFVLIDLPSDHEIDGWLITEPQMISAILHNRALGDRVQHFRATSNEGLIKISGPYEDLKFVHLATHGSETGISLIGSTITWEKMAHRLRAVAPQLSDGKERVSCLSCCFSSVGYSRMKVGLKGHFTGAYYFHEEKVDFHITMAVWAMFYSKEKLGENRAMIVDRINTFFRDEVICFGTI